MILEKLSNKLTQRKTYIDPPGNWKWTGTGLTGRVGSVGLGESRDRKRREE